MPKNIFVLRRQYAELLGDQVSYVCNFISNGLAKKNICVCIHEYVPLCVYVCGERERQKANVAKEMVNPCEEYMRKP